MLPDGDSAAVSAGCFMMKNLLPFVSFSVFPSVKIPHWICVLFSSASLKVFFKKFLIAVLLSC